MASHSGRVHLDGRSVDDKVLLTLRKLPHYSAIYIDSFCKYIIYLLDYVIIKIYYYLLQRQLANRITDVVHKHCDLFVCQVL